MVWYKLVVIWSLWCWIKLWCKLDNASACFPHSERQLHLLGLHPLLLHPFLLFLKILDFLFQPELRFVATVTTGGRVKFVPAVQNFQENNIFSLIICVDEQVWFFSSSVEFFTHLVTLNKQAQKLFQVDLRCIFSTFLHRNIGLRRRRHQLVPVRDIL